MYDFMRDVTYYCQLYKYIDTNRVAHSAIERTNLTTECRHTFEPTECLETVNKNIKS